jgi:hypothetical protein
MRQRALGASDRYSEHLWLRMSSQESAFSRASDLDASHLVFDAVMYSSDFSDSAKIRRCSSHLVAYREKQDVL